MVMKFGHVLEQTNEESKVAVRAEPSAKARSIQPLDGGFDGYVVTLDQIRKHVQDCSSLTRDDLKRWYWQRYGLNRKLKDGHSFDTTTDAYINSLFKSGLLVERKDGAIGCRRLPRNSEKKNIRVVEIVDGNVVFVLGMLEAAREWTTEDNLLKVAKEKHRLDLSVQQIRHRRGWLQSAGMLEAYAAKDKRFRATLAARRLLVDELNAPPSAVNPTEFSGGGEGEEHRKLKEHVHEHCEDIVDAPVDTRAVEYELPSGDRVDVTACNQSTIWHIEVKSQISNDNDVRRGLYQCVKYRAVGKATERLQRRNAPRKVVSLLVVGRKLGAKLKKEAKVLGVRYLVVLR